LVRLTAAGRRTARAAAGDLIRARFGLPNGADPAGLRTLTATLRDIRRGADDFEPTADSEQ